MPKVQLLNGIEFDCLPGQTILDAAKLNKISIEYSCNNGRCRSCIAPLIKGETRLLQSEQSLSEIDIGDGRILTCCREPISDISLNIEDLGEIGNMPTLTLPCRIDNLDFLNKDVVRVILRLPPNSNFHYIPGQYINLKKGNISRSYSIACAPRDDGKIELHIKKLVNGFMSNYFFNDALENDLLMIEGPLGTFSYRKNKAENIIFMATGTGIAPIKSILESFLLDPQKKNIYLFWGAKNLSDLYLNPNSLIDDNFFPVLSRERIDGHYHGYVQDALLDLGINISNSAVYACGSIEMINDSSRALIKNGLNENNFYSDAFVSSN